MTNDEAIGSINARNAARREMGLSPMHHILVTNRRRKSGIGVVREATEPFQPKAIEEVIEKRHPDVSLIDPDQLIIRELADMAASADLPLELVTTPKRTEEYQKNLGALVEDHNRRVDQGLEQNKTRIATQADGVKTLTIFYGDNDENTIADVEKYFTEFSLEGDVVAIINDPEKVTRLPEGTKYICVGTIVAKAIYREFSDLVKQEKIVLS